MIDSYRTRVQDCNALKRWGSPQRVLQVAALACLILLSVWRPYQSGFSMTILDEVADVEPKTKMEAETKAYSTSGVVTDAEPESEIDSLTGSNENVADAQQKTKTEVETKAFSPSPVPPASDDSDSSQGTLVTTLASNDGINNDDHYHIPPRPSLTLDRVVTVALVVPETSSPTGVRGEDTRVPSVVTYAEPESEKPKWKCCVDPSLVDFQGHPDPMTVVSKSHSSYACPEKPSNFSWYFSSPDPLASTKSLDEEKWKNKKLLFVGGSTTRQMQEQLKWEMPEVSRQAAFSFDSFLFEVPGRSWNSGPFDASHSVDLRYLSPNLQEGLSLGYDFIILNVGVWWDFNFIGRVIDTNGTSWAVDSSKGKEWNILNATNSSSLQPPSVLFSFLMERAFRMMLEIKSPNTTLVWRSETKTDCPPGHGHRGSVANVLKSLDIPVLNISEATCSYGMQELDDSTKVGPHLCFPSVALRHWLLKFQDQFL
jgi:hypothetical protein